jgi:hypothetical protein
MSLGSGLRSVQRAEDAACSSPHRPGSRTSRSGRRRRAARSGCLPMCRLSPTPSPGLTRTTQATAAQAGRRVGGTSLASPVIAAMWALAGGAHGVAYPASTLYGHLGSSSLYDVTSGGNGFCGGAGAAQCGNPNQLTFNGAALGVLDCDYPATGNTPSVGDLACDASAGYDGPTGVGTPIGFGAFMPTTPTATIRAPASVTHGARTVADHEGSFTGG